MFLTCVSQTRPAAERLEQYLFLLQNKSVGLIANQTSLIKNTHLLDTLLSRGVDIRKIFTPEHGFRGKADAGEKVFDGKDVKTGLPIISLYGKHKKPNAEDLQGIDVMVFDIQDVGVRFYTYISTLHYIMEACAENKVELIVLDRPNPNAFYIDGPVLENKYKSFVGMHNVPIVYGMSIGEYALMIKGEKWINKVDNCKLKVIVMERWTHQTRYVLPVKPSPNLPNEESILLYPSLCFFEGTIVSAGRGTDFPFQIFGMPEMSETGFSFKPRSIIGASKYPKFQDKDCVGVDLRGDGKLIRKDSQLNLSYLIYAYNNAYKKDSFFNNFFENLAGTSKLRQQIISGKSEKEIKASWQKGLKDFKHIRSKYLLYK
jgi:uncharacterized protein YbbC (DUF1343 family)